VWADRSVPDVWCSEWARDYAARFNGSSIWDVANVVRGDELGRKPISDCMLCGVTLMHGVWASSLQSGSRNLTLIVVVVDDGRVVLVACSCVWCPYVPLAATVTLDGAGPTLRDARPPTRGHVGQWYMYVRWYYLISIIEVLAVVVCRWCSMPALLHMYSD
jgi:hypothetical protein